MLELYQKLVFPTKRLIDDFSGYFWMASQLCILLKALVRGKIKILRTKWPELRSPWDLNWERRKKYIRFILQFIHSFHSWNFLNSTFVVTNRYNNNVLKSNTRSSVPELAPLSILKRNGYFKSVRLHAASNMLQVY